MTDFLQRFMFDNLPVRGELIRLSEATKEIIAQHDYPKVIHTALTETLCTSALLSALLKFDGQLTIQLQNQGELKLLVAKCTNNLEIRGLAQLADEANETSVLNEIRHGELAITIEEIAKNHRFQSIVKLDDQPISAALESYFEQSEQLTTKLYLMSEGTEVYGLLLQAMPDQDGKYDKEQTWDYLTALANTLTFEDFKSNDNETLLQKLFHEDTIRVFDKQEIKFKCTCSFEKMSEAIRMYGKEEAMNILSTNKVISVVCEFCNNHFDFSKEDVEHIFQLH